MELEYYKEYFDLERGHWWFVAREKIIMTQIKLMQTKNNLPKENLKILNIGCGTGRSSEYLSQFGEVTSLEYDKFCCEFTTAKTGLKIINGSITELPFSDNEFDLVCAFDVIEHVEDHKKGVEEMKRVCKNNGINLITVPAFMNLWGEHDEINHHFRRYSLLEIKNLYKDATGNGSELFSTYFNFFLFTPILLFRKLSNLLKGILKRKGSGSDFGAVNTGFANNLLMQLMYSENIFLKRRIKLPFGVSILFTWKKEPDS